MDLASRLGGLPNPARSNTGYLRMRLAPSLACVACIRKWHRTANESGAAAIFFVIRPFRALLHRAMRSLFCKCSEFFPSAKTQL